MKNGIRWGILCVFLLIGSASFGMFSENSRQGSNPIFSITDQGVELLNPAHDLGSEGSDGKNRVRLNNHAKVLTPYLFSGRRWDAFSQTYNHRNRQYSPKVGRFVSRDSLGFKKSKNLWAYANLNPLKYVDPWGLQPEWPFWKINSFEKFTEEFNLPPNDLTTQLLYEEMVLSKQDPGEMLGRMTEILAGLESVALIEELGLKIITRAPSSIKCVTQQAVEEAKKIRMSEIEFDLQLFAGKKLDIQQIEKIVNELKLSRGQRRLLHDQITKQGYSIEEIFEIAQDIKNQFPNK